MSTVVDTTVDGDEDGGGGRDPFAGDRIELDEGELRAISPGAWLAGLKRRLDEAATRFTYDP